MAEENKQTAQELADAALAERKAHRDDGMSPKDSWKARERLRKALDAYEKEKEMEVKP